MQRSIGSISTIENISLMANIEKKFTVEKFKKKDTQPVCTNCGYRGHIVDKYYRLHGYPPGHRLANNNLVHLQRSKNSMQTSNEMPSKIAKGNQSTFFASLNNDQYSQLLNMMQTHLNFQQIDEISNKETTHIAGHTYFATIVDDKSRDVLFFEERFPFQSIKEDNKHISHDFIDQFVIPSPLFDHLENKGFHPFKDNHGIVDPQPHIETSKETNHLIQTTIPTASRRSSRPHCPPSYLKDFHCNLTSHRKSPFPLEKYLSYNSYNQNHKKYTLNVTSIYEPTYYHQAMNHQNWKKAMAEEIEAMERTNTWTIVSLPKNYHTVGSKWVYKVKYKQHGTVDRYKARLIAKGYNQQEGIDFSDTFSLVAKIVTVKIFLALVASYNWSFTQMDINNAFLNGDLFEEVRMSLPLGYQTSQVPRNGEKLAYKLNKSIYGPKQASRQWFLKFAAALSLHGFHQSKSDYSLFTQGHGHDFVALLVYVDDILLTGPSPK
ncbi:Reverse transcriptase, RNA-dependent DNA polymerase [Cucumis melo var. makuwa]|uniref:Reverse transcriptase, RNA-dependent DNA polymerase n=1 Tax=Cucumis melo var. makuwa TaxID=1194695 RepID=A0A5A7TK43_CUCMM|nr:Reverse transcriptase, RNA-dependent DNA polymerase [Cucumis melo var. makuwa]TYK09733.1 Reverse transcriptase, RNA-dependent DNA polymerase [Cucumis melo var. makuwa]